MEGARAHVRSLQSTLCATAKPNRLLASSASAGWTSLHLDHHEGAGDSGVFDTHLTDDLTLAVATEGIHDVAVLSRGRWRTAVYQVGSAGLTPPGEVSRLRWRTPSEQQPFRMASIYLPGSLATDLAEEYRRAGQSASVSELSTLAFRDPLITLQARALMAAMAEGQPDLYAAGAARWLLTHLIAKQARWRHLTDDQRLAGIITDRRLRRVIEYMSAHLDCDLTIDELAREAGISAHHFGRLFREATGMGPARFLTSLRMAQAKLLLRTTDLPIATIGFRCGYRSASAFATAFLRGAGVTASAYRAS